MNNGNDKELAAGRIEKIRQILSERRISRVNELCAELGASPASIRRDLAEMETRGMLRRVHGGAVCTETRLEEPMFDDKASLAPKEKQRIAKAALELIKPNDSIFLDGGSTILALARLLGDMPRLSVATNSFRVAGAFAANGPRTILIGGELRRLSQTFVGNLTEPLISHLHVDTAFMGTVGITPTSMTTTDPAEAQTKELIMSRARQVILLADSSKIGKISFVDFGKPDDVDMLITDSGISPADVKKFKKRGLRVIAV